MKKIINHFNKCSLKKVKLYSFYWFGYRYGEDYSKTDKMNKEEIIKCLHDEFCINEFTEKEIFRTLEDLETEGFLEFKEFNYK